MMIDDCKLKIEGRLKRPARDASRYRLGRSAALPGEGSWCVYYGDFMNDPDYQVIDGFLPKREAVKLLERLQAEARRSADPEFAGEFFKHMKTKQEAKENGTVETKDNPLKGRVWTMEIPRERIVPSGTNPRKEFPEEMIRQRAESLTKQGQLVALIVRPVGLKNDDLRLTIDDFEKLVGDPKTRFEIADGECRWRASAAKFADLKMLKVDVRALSDEEVTEIQWSSWLQREGLSPLDEARGIAALKGQGWSNERLEERFGIKKSSIYGAVKLAKAEGPLLKALEAQEINPSVAALVAGVPDAGSRAELMKKGHESVFDWSGAVRSVREVKAIIENRFMRQIPWKLDAIYTHKGAVSPACAACPKMTRNMGETDPEIVKGPARCLGLTCFGERQAVEAAAKKLEMEKIGLKYFTFQERRESKIGAEWCREGDSHWTGGDYVPYEKLAAKGKVAHAGVVEDGNGGTQRLWKRADLVKAGVLKKEKRSSYSSSGSHNNEKYKEEQEILEKLQGVVKAELIEKVTKGMDGVSLPAVISKLLRAFYYEEEGRYGKRKTGDIKVGDVLAWFATSLWEGWYNLKSPPKGLVEVMGVDVKKLEATVRAERKAAAAAKAELAAKKKEEGREKLNAKTAKSAKKTAKKK